MMRVKREFFLTLEYEGIASILPTFTRHLYSAEPQFFGQISFALFRRYNKLED
jgi:hypothetical protein